MAEGSSENSILGVTDKLLDGCSENCKDGIKLIASEGTREGTEESLLEGNVLGLDECVADAKPEGGELGVLDC